MHEGSVGLVHSLGARFRSREKKTEIRKKHANPRIFAVVTFAAVSERGKRNERDKEKSDEATLCGPFLVVLMATRFAENMLVSYDGNADANRDLGRCLMFMMRRQQLAYQLAVVALVPSTTILLGVLRVNILLLLVLLNSRWWCRRACAHARHVSLWHAVAFRVVEVLVRSDRRSEDASRNLLHVASLLRGLWGHEVRVDRGLDLLDVDIRCSLGSLLSEKCLPLEELLNCGSHGREVRRAVLPLQCR